jgi:hemoglobin-like flavoprotein
MPLDRIMLVRSSWPTVARRADDLTTTFYATLFEIDPSAARLFTGVDMVAQRRKLTQALGVVVHALDDLERLIPPLTHLGRRHTNYGVEHSHFDSVGVALIKALGQVLGEDFTAQVQAAWTEAYGVVSAVMRRAMLTTQAETA